MTENCPEGREFPSYPEPEPFDAEAERKKIRADERDQAKRTYDVSEARWRRFWTACAVVVVGVVVSGLVLWMVIAIRDNNAWNNARTEWLTQCRIEGGIPARDIDLKDGPVLCVIGDKVVRTR